MAINTSSLLGRRDVFFIDASLPDLFTLTSALSADAEIHFIDAMQDGLEQIALTLRGLHGESGIDAIHIFSHGSAGELSIGSTTLSSYNINSYAATLSQIGSALSPAGDILLYGCNVAAGDEGRAFVESVARLTQADVAASDDVTGSAALGGDWILENNSDAIEAKGLFVPEWTGMLGDDYADDRTGATALTLGVAKNGNLEVVSDQDYFKIDLVAGQRYLFEMTASGIGSLDTAYLHLYNSSGYSIDSAANADLATFSYVATSSGTVYLEASELSDDSTGSYTVKATLVTTSDDYADDRTGATALTLGVAKNGNLEVVSDQDYFKIDLVAGQRYLFEMTASGIGSLDTAYLHLYNSSGYSIDSAANADLATFSYVATSSGTVYLEASELSDDSTGSYTVKATLVTTSDDYADDRTGATALTLGVAKNGNLEVVSDQDYFKIDLVAGQRYLFEMTASGIGSLDTAYLHLYNSSGYSIDSAANADLATFSYVATSSGTVYLEASELSDDSIGSYTVKASLVNETHEPTGLVTITGTAIQNQTLTAANTLTDPDGPTTLNISYQWKANGVDILEATGSTLILNQTQVGQTISVTASYTDGQGAAESVVSAATTAVVNVNDVPTGTVNIIGTATQGQMLTATNNLADADGMGIVSYKWQADGVDITDATGSTLMLAETNVGEKIIVTASYTDGYQTAENVTSSTTDVVIPLNKEVDLSGNITFWQSGLPITAVTSTLTSPPVVAGTRPIEFRNIHTAVDGSRTLEIWETSPTAALNSVLLELALPTGSTAVWQDATGLPSGWNSSANTDKPGQFNLGGTGTTALSAGSVNLGTLTLSAPANPKYFELSLTTGQLGNDTIPAFGISSDSMTTGTDGLYQHLDMAGTYTHTSAKVSGTAESNAIKANDALAALKIAVGMNPNADGSAVSSYQYLAADVNHDGQVKAADALNILKMAVKLSSAPEKEWLFVPESIGSESMSRSHVVWPDNPISVTLDIDQELHLIGIVKGDVNGSWAAA